MAGKKCDVCGKPSGFFPLCKECNELKEQGKIIKDEESGKWILNKNNISNNRCIICNSESKNPLCTNHWQEMISYKENLFTMTLEELDLYFYNMNSYIYRYRYHNAYKTQALKLIAIAYVIKEKFNNDSYIDRAIKRIKQINEYLNKENENIENEKDNSKNYITNDINSEIAEKELDKVIYADDNHKVRSEAEKTIDNALYNMRIVHAYEIELPTNENENKMYCDWFIPVRSNNKGIYIEYWGMETKDYLERKQAKLKFYNDKKLPLIQIEKYETQNGPRLTSNLEKDINKLAEEYFKVFDFTKN